MDLDLKNKVALVMAASKGLGKAAALSLANEGCRVAICARNKPELEQSAQEIEKQSGVDILPVVADVSHVDDINNFVQTTLDHWGQADILVCNAGGPPVKSFAETNDEEWRYWYEVTFMSVVRAVRAVLPQMQKNHWGRIINITSISVKAPVESLIYSNALRMAVVGLAKSLSLELGPDGITVNNVAPGYHLTDGLERIVNKKVDQGMERQEVIDQWATQVPLKRIGLPADLAGLITFLASDQAAYLNGTTIQVDGGMYRGTL